MQQRTSSLAERSPVVREFPSPSLRSPPLKATSHPLSSSMGHFPSSSSPPAMSSPSFSRRSLMAGHRLRLLQVIVLVANLSCFIVLLNNVLDPVSSSSGSTERTGTWRDMLNINGLIGSGGAPGAFTRDMECLPFVDDLATLQEEHNMLVEEHTLLLERNKQTLALAQSNEVGLKGMKQDCDVCAEGDLFCKAFGEHNYARSVIYSGTNSRLYRFFDKLKRGEAVTVSVVGGSVSFGQGLRINDDDKGKPVNMHSVIFDHIQKLFPHPDHKFLNDAQAAQGSYYYNMCFKEHIEYESDLILVELAINDGRELGAMETYETLLRGLLAIPNQPALIAMHTFGLVFDRLTTGGDLHHGISAYYDIPTLSLKNVVLPQVLEDEARMTTYEKGEPVDTPPSHVFWFAPWGGPGNSPDVRHFGRAGHNALGNLVNMYIDRSLCDMDYRRQKFGKEINPVYEQFKWQYPQYGAQEAIPRLMLSDKYDMDTVRGKMDPICSSTTSTRNPLKASTSDGWRDWAWKHKKYIIADVPGSTITFDFTTAVGIVKIGYQRSGQYGLGMVDCWVDDEVNKKKRLDGYWTKTVNIGQTETIREGLAAGEHTMTCKLLDETHDPNGGKEFRLMSLTTL